MSQLKSHYLLDPEVVFLNHGSFGATPKPVFAEYQNWQRRLEKQPVLFLGRELTSLLRQAAKYNLKELKESVSHMEQIVNLADPKSVLKRGYAIIRKGDDVSTSLETLSKDEEVTIEYHDGEASAKIIEIKKATK